MLAQIHREGKAAAEAKAERLGISASRVKRWLSRGFDVAVAKATSAPKAKRPAKKAAAKKPAGKPKGQDA
jgi:hypothetical protein